MENKLPIDKEKLKELINEVFSKPIETERKLRIYVYDYKTISQMMKE